MRIKSTQSEMTAVATGLKVLLDAFKPTAIEEKLIRELVFKTYQKIRNNSEIPKRSGFAIVLNDQEAMAMFLFINRWELDYKAYPLEANRLQCLSDKIHQAHV